MSRQAIRTMMRTPTLTAIYAAELRVAQSRLQTHAALHRGRITFRATLARPASLVTVAAVAAILGYWLTRRSRPTVPASDRVSNVRMAPAAAFILAFIVRYAKQQLPAILRQVWAAQQNRAAHANSDMSQWPDTGVLH
jgi:hypothetical protein